MPATKEWVSTRRLIAPPPFPIRPTGAFALKVTKLRGQRYFLVSNFSAPQGERCRGRVLPPSGRPTQVGTTLGLAFRATVVPENRAEIVVAF